MRHFVLVLSLLVLGVSVIGDPNEKQPPSSLDLRNYLGSNYVTSVKSQTGGTCWTHGTMSAMESNLLFSGNWAAAGDTGEPNLAEYHLDWWNGFNQHHNDDITPPDGAGLEVHFGGDYRVSAAYLARGEGAVRDIDGQSYTTPPERFSDDYRYYYPRDIVWFSVDDTLGNIDVVKQAIMDHGAIGTCVLTGFLNGIYQYQPYYDDSDPDHAVAIVGWHDHQSVPGAPAPGAWLCKNSWGSWWGNNGYFWTSYYDRHSGHHPEMGAVSFQNVEVWSWDNVYYHDYHGWRSTLESSNEAFNRFYIAEGGYISSVSFITAANDVDYTVKVYGTFDGEDPVNELHSQSGSVEYMGLHTIDLTTPVPVQNGEAVVYLEVSHGGQGFDCTSVVPVLLGKKYRTVVASSAMYDESYYKNGGEWSDLWDYNQTGNFCMKALIDSRVEIDVDTTWGWAPFNVNCDASSELVADNWTWTFGDSKGASGSSSTSHTYTEAGVYDVSVTMQSSDSSFTAVERNCIAVLADTLWTDTVSIVEPSTFALTIYGNNTLPLHRLKIPVQFTGDLSLSIDSASKVGCRTEHLDVLDMVQYDPNGYATFMLNWEAAPGSRYLEPGSGPLLKVYFTCAGNTPAANEISLAGFGFFQPRFSSDRAVYYPGSKPGMIEFVDCCQGFRGNFNFDPDDSIDISDLVSMVAYMFQGGTPPVCWTEANVTGDIMGDIMHTVDIEDLVYLVDYMFNAGPEPAMCP